MALSGALLADFSSFTTATEGAVVKLRAFESGSEKVATSLSRMTESFSGRKIIQEATLMAQVFDRAGGAAAFTDAELQRMGTVGAAAMAKLQAAGLPIPPGIARIGAEAKTTGTTLQGLGSTATSLAAAFGVTFSIGAVVGFGKSLLDTADTLVRVSDRTGLFIGDVQRLEYVAKQSGGSLDALTGAIGKMQLNLNDPKAQQAFRDLNINFAELSAANPYQQFELIATAVGQIENPVLQAEAAVAIFGKTGLDILPQLKSKFSELAAEATVSGDAQVRAMDALGDALDRQLTRGKNAAVGAAGGVALVAEKVGWLQTAMALLGGAGAGNVDLFFGQMKEDALASVAALEDVGAEVPAVVDVLDTYRAHLDEVSLGVTALSASEQDLIRDAVALRESTTDIATALNLMPAAVEQYVAAVKAGDVETQKFKDAVSELDGAGLKWKDTLNALDGETVNAIQYYLQAGVSQAALATAYGLTAGEIRNVVSALGEEKAAIDAATQAENARAAAKAAADAAIQKERAAITPNDQYGIKQQYGQSPSEAFAGLKPIAGGGMTDASGKAITSITQDIAPAAPPSYVGPGKSSGGGSITITINAAGLTPAELTRQIEAELVKSAKLKRLVGGGT